MSTRKIGTSTKALTHTICCIGDSITLAPYSFPGLRADLHWPEAVAKKLRVLGANVKARNCGIAGQTSTQMAASPRINAPLLFEVPDIVAIYAGINDSNNSISQATTQANLQTMVQNYITAGVSKVLIVGQHYLNFPSSGDTTSAQDATSSSLRTAQSNASAASYTGAGSVAYVDLYAAMRAYIGSTYVYNGTTYTISQGVDCSPSLGMFNWHVAGSFNTHLNALGQDMIAAAVVAKIQALGWLASLST